MGASHYQTAAGSRNVRGGLLQRSGRRCRGSGRQQHCDTPPSASPCGHCRPARHTPCSSLPAATCCHQTPHGAARGGGTEWLPHRAVPGTATASPGPCRDEGRLAGSADRRHGLERGLWRAAEGHCTAAAGEAGAVSEAGSRRPAAAHGPSPPRARTAVATNGFSPSHPGTSLPSAPARARPLPPSPTQSPPRSSPLTHSRPPPPPHPGPACAGHSPAPPGV